MTASLDRVYHSAESRAAVGAARFRVFGSSPTHVMTHEGRVEHAGRPRATNMKTSQRGLVNRVVVSGLRIDLSRQSERTVLHRSMPDAVSRRLIHGTVVAILSDSRRLFRRSDRFDNRIALGDAICDETVRHGANCF